MGYMTDERRLIQETARAFAMKEVLPLANKLDPEKGDMPRELIHKLADMGYFGIVIPEQYGGMGLGVFEYCLITEELARAWMSVASIIARGNGLSAGRGMTEAQRAVFLPRAARGEFLGAAAMSVSRGKACQRSVGRTLSTANHSKVSPISLSPVSCPRVGG